MLTAKQLWDNTGSVPACTCGGVSWCENLATYLLLTRFFSLLSSLHKLQSHFLRHAHTLPLSNHYKKYGPSLCPNVTSPKATSQCSEESEMGGRRENKRESIFVICSKTPLFFPIPSLFITCVYRLFTPTGFSLLSKNPPSFSLSLPPFLSHPPTSWFLLTAMWR